MISCVIETYYLPANTTNQIMRLRVAGLHRANHKIIWLFLSIHVMKLGGI